MATDPCPVCGANRVIVGKQHRCVAVTKPVTKPFVTKPARDFVIDADSGRVESRSKGGRPPLGKKAMTGAERVRRHRQQRRS
jgi:hypothetical protein